MTIAFGRDLHERATPCKQRTAGRGDDSLAQDRVLSHELPLVVVEGGRLVQDGVGDRDLPDVVQLRGAAEGGELSGGQAEVLAHCRSQGLDGVPVL